MHAAFRTRHLALSLIGALSIISSTAATATAADPPPPVRDGGRAWAEPAAAQDARYIVTFEPGTNLRTRARIGRSLGLSHVRAIRGRDADVFEATGSTPDVAALDRPDGVVSVARSLRSSAHVEPTDGLWKATYLWGMHNTGQRIFGVTGVANVDVDAYEAWGRTTGSPEVIVAVIDDGVDFGHPDLAARAWRNPGESGLDAGNNDRATNGIDDDGNGYVDDVNGWDFCHDDNTVHDFDEDFHGTHVAATIAASMDGQGVVGVAPTVSIMALKFLGKDPACGWDDQAVEAIAYAKSFGVRISNNSWGRRGGTSTENAALYGAIRDSGMLFVASAGNDGINNDTSSRPAYPASFNLPNVLSVAAVDNRGRLPWWSNYGRRRVDVLAPGVETVSAVPADSEYPSPGWARLSGTSMAAPHVTGIAALMASVRPSLLSADGVATMKSRIMTTGKKLTAVSGRTVTDAIPSAQRAIDFVAPVAFAPATHGFIRGTRLGSTVKTRVGWPAATDDFSGIASYAVRHSVNDGGWITLAGATTARTIDRSLAIGSRYRYRVRARDRGGNLSPWADGPQVRPRLVQQSNKAVTYHGRWFGSRSSSASGGSTRYATRAGAWVQYSFTGRAIAVVAPKSASRGSVKVYVDGAYIRTVKTYRSSLKTRVLVFARSWASPGPHTIRLVVAGTGNHPRFDIDAFVVLEEAGTASAQLPRYVVIE